MKPNQAECSNCGKKIEEEDSYDHNHRVLCEDCFVEAKMTRKRKTHWQYLTSIKTDYLRANEKS